MPEIVQNFEDIAARFSPAILTGAGAAILLVGLTIWLGGLWLKRFLVAIIGAAAGGACGFFMFGRNIMAIAISAALAAIISAILEKILLPVLAAALAVILGIAVLALPYLKESVETTPINKNQIQENTDHLSNKQTIKAIKSYAFNFAAEINRTRPQIPLYNWAIIAVVATAFFAAGFFFGHLIAAWWCATSGTILVFTGMISLLFYKGAMPLSRISQRPHFYISVFTAMMIFGTAEQLLICKHIKRKQISKKPIEQKPEKKPLSWRTK